MTKGIGLESLVQRGRSPFYNELVSLYQESQNAVAELHDPSHGQISLALKSVNFKERVRSIVFKHMGVKLHKVYITESSTINLMCGMEATKDSVAKMEKTSEASPGMLLEKINRVYDDRAGYLNSTEDADKLPYVFSLYMYTSLWKIKNTDGSFYFTAEEICAAMIHEFGHIDHYIRASLRIYGRMLDSSDIINYVQAHPNRDVILQLIEKVKTSPYLGKEWAPIIATTEDYFRKSNAIDDPYFYEALSMLMAVAVAERAAWQLFWYSNLLGGGRDRVGTLNHNVDAERSADEFATRNGAGQAMVSMLGKLHASWENKSYLAYRQYLWSGPALFFGICTHFLAIFNTMPEEVAFGYDPLIRRMELIVETTKHAFHDPDLPDEAKHDLQSQIEKAEKYIALYKTPMYRRLRHKFKTWRDNVNKLNRILISPLHNRLSGSYDKLQNDTRSLSRHALYYLAHKR